ncbi:MAG: DEAD/DEAH box helicase family protein [Synergistales bacterium]|nr:DEAD/DEAH box helicase family protein [Synergistales bacterium]
MANKAKRIIQVQRLNLSEHTLDINVRKCNYSKFRFADVEDYVRAITGSREYQFQAIRQTMIYLWGGGYEDVAELARENFNKKDNIRERFGNEEIMLGHLPLSDRLSGVIHMATGTGKSFVIFAIAYLSIVMGLTKRVLVLGPSSTIIEEGLRDKFQEFINKKEWNDRLPQEYRGKAVSLLSDNDSSEDGSITIENINAIYTDGGINDTFFKDVDEVLVLGDEIHHAYSHLNFNVQKKSLEIDKEENPLKGKVSDEKTERLWMQFLKKHSQITRHIGFTGTPYNRDDYFADVIFDYNIRSAVNEKYIKDINPILSTEIEDSESEMQWTTEKRFEVVYLKHLENSERYAYLNDKGERRVKPVTVFYCPTQANAKKRYEEFVRFLADWERKHNGATGPLSETEQVVRGKVICVVSNISESEYKNELDNIEEIDPEKPGGKVEFIFSVGKLLEGWDVDNVFQIVPVEERVFNSKLLISQVLGRGLRIPRKISHMDVISNYPWLTVTNHEKFAEHIRELMDAVTHSDRYISSIPLEKLDKEEWRGNHHFNLFNLNYLPSARLEDVAREKKERPLIKDLTLEKSSTEEKVLIERSKSTDKYVLKRKTVSADSVVDAIFRRFKSREYEGIRFDFGSGEEFRCPTEDEIRSTILLSMERAGIPSNGLTENNAKQINLFFNQFLPAGTKKRLFDNVQGNLITASTSLMERSSLRVGELERDGTAFLSERYEEETDERTKALVDYISEIRGRLRRSNTNPLQKGMQFDFTDSTGLLEEYGEFVRPIVPGDDRPPYIVNVSIFKTPQSTVLVSHSPEKIFVFRLLEHAEYLDTWIKSPDKGFYSIGYEYWKKGKDRVRRGFNPDFFIKIDLDQYISHLKRKGISGSLRSLIELQENGKQSLIRVVEIKYDDDEDEATAAKEEFAKAHFESLNKRLAEVNPVDVTEEFQADLKQHYTFDLLKPKDYEKWFLNLRIGVI